MRGYMHTTTIDTHTSSVEFDFVKGHIAATMTLIHGLIDQGLIDRDEEAELKGKLFEVIRGGRNN